jgi:hypothetical protein
MKQVGEWEFEVSPGETVTFKVMPRETEARYVGVWLDGQKMTSLPEFQPYCEYRWTIIRAVGEIHLLMLECNFSRTAPATARYDFWVIGSKNEKGFLCNVEKKYGNNQDIDIQFRVAYEAGQDPHFRSYPASGGVSWYRAKTFALVGSLIRPFHKVIEPQASLVLHPAGGHEKSRVENFRLEGILSIRAAYTEVGGSFDETHQIHTSFATTVIEGLNIANIVTADRVVSRFASYSPVVGDNQGEYSFDITGSHFEDLRIAGHRIDLKLATHRFYEYDTYSKVKKAVRNGQAADLAPWGKLSETRLRDLEKLEEDYRALKGLSDRARRWRSMQPKDTWDDDAWYSAASGLNLREETEGLKNFGAIILVPHFGVVRLAEIRIDRSFRQLIMIRLDLGSPIEGRIDVANADVGGGMRSAFDHESGPPLDRTEKVRDSDVVDADPLETSVGESANAESSPGDGGNGGTPGSRPKNWKRAKPPLKLRPEFVEQSPKVPEVSFTPENTIVHPGPETSKAGARPAGRLLKPAKERIVNLGFATGQPIAPLKPTQPLTCGESYYFWFQVGQLMEESAEADAPMTLPVEHLPIQARLQVVLFVFPGGLQIENGSAVGELTLQGDGSAVVSRQAIELKIAISDRLKDSLFFAVRVPGRSGKYKLRCSIYCQQVLVQSRLISVRVMKRPSSFTKAVHSKMDYTLSQTIRPSRLSGIQPHQLSVMLNDNGNGKIGLRFFGDKEFNESASFDGPMLQDLINQARGTLRMAAWGDKDPWNQNKNYRYQGGGSFNQMKADLVQMAKKGYSFYSNIIDKFTGGQEQTDLLAALMRKPGLIQIAIKESARCLIPAALIYDYPLDNGLNNSDYNICASFQQAFNAKTALEDTGCFKGLCPVKEDNVICPSGFWGFRHFLGMPLSVAAAPDAPMEIGWQGSPHLAVAVSTELAAREQHVKALKALKVGWGWDFADTRDAAIAVMKNKHPHIVYFYCHGGLADNEPYIRVGPRDGPRFTESLLRSKKILWDVPRPLVFINGCHTTAVEPEQAMEFVSSFVRLAHAAGVIGTEITVFEPLAQAFAENFMRKFVVESKSVGEAIRSSRLALLASGNPLGLAYIPFAIASIKMLEQAVGPAS